MPWLIDNANIWYVLLGIALLGFGTAWWLHRRPKYLLAAAAALGLIALLWLLTRLVVTDRKQLELNVRAMADAVVEGKADVLLKFLANDFTYEGRKRELIAEGIAKAAKKYQVYDITISGFQIEDLSDRAATVFFRAMAHSRVDERPYFAASRGSFIKENGQWKLREVRFFNPVVNQTQPIQLPIP